MNADGKQEKRRQMRILLCDWGLTMKNIERKRKEKDTFLEWAHDDYSTLGAQIISDMPISRGRGCSVVERKAQQMMDHPSAFAEEARRIDLDIEVLIQRKAMMDEHIRELPERQQEVLHLRYKERHGWKYISIKVSCDERTAQRMELKALDKLSRFVAFDVLE